MFKRVVSMMLVAVILIATGSECFAGGRYGRRNYSRHQSNGVNISSFGKAVLYITGAVIAVKAADRILGTDQHLAYPGTYPQGVYIPSECTQFLGNSRALNACISGVAQRQLQDQQQLERDAYRVGYGR